MAPLGRTRVLLANLAFSPFPKVPHLADFDPSVLLGAGIGRVALIRHGNTAPSPDGVDFDRQLTDLGRDQARSAGSSYGRELLRPYHPVALCSLAPRCVETAGIFLDASRTDGDGFLPEPKCVPGLYDGSMQPEGSRLFRKIGYAPLRSYLDDPDEGDRSTAHDVLGSYAAIALDAMAEAAADSPASGETVESPPDEHKQQQQQQRTTLLLFAHAVYLPAAALALASSCGCTGESNDLILDTNTKEAEGYLVDVAGSETSLLCRERGLSANH